jgi:hypothetical protein
MVEIISVTTPMDTDISDDESSVLDISESQDSPTFARYFTVSKEKSV